MLKNIFYYFKFWKKDLSELTHEPKANEVVYHYCDNNAFWSICSNKSMWLSSIFRMNDESELSWGRGILIDTLKANKNKFSQEFYDFITTNVFYLDIHSLVVLCSFSKNGDLLSQWTRYANDAQGFSIGFNAKLMKDTLPINMKKVSYEVDTQERLVLNSLKIFNRYWQKSKHLPIEKIINIFSEVLAGFSADLASLKHPTFFEEQEIRILHLLSKNKENGNWYSPGGNNIYGHVAGIPVLSRTTNNKKITYINLPFTDHNIISEVVIGAKNKISIEELREKLKNIGLVEINIRRSACPYR